MLMEKKPMNFSAAQRIIQEFVLEHDIRWQDFRKLSAMGPEYKGCNRYSWKDAVTGKHINPQAETRRKVIAVATRIRGSAEDVLVHLQAGSPQTRSGSDPPILADHSATIALAGPPCGSSDTFADDGIRLAGAGFPKHAFDLLREEFKRKVYHHPDDALDCLRALIYVAARYLHAFDLIRDLEFLILPALDRSKAAGLAAPSRRGLVLSQAGIFAQDHSSQRLAKLFIDHPEVTSLTNENTTFPAVRAQLLNNMASGSAALRNVKDARWQLHRVEELQAGKNSVSTVIAANTVARVFEPEKDTAWCIIRPEYEKNREILLDCYANRRLTCSSLVHQFVTLLRGAICRATLGAYSAGELDEDCQAMQWVLNLVSSIPAEADFYPKPATQLPAALEKIRRSCLSRHLTGDQELVLAKLFAAMDTSASGRPRPRQPPSSRPFSSNAL